MKADDAFNVCTAIGQHLNRGAPKAVPDRCDPFGIDLRLLFEYFQAGQGPFFFNAEQGIFQLGIPGMMDKCLTGVA